MDLRTTASLWTTPCADDTATRTTQYAQGGTALSMQADQWSTPRASDGEKGGPNMTFGAGGTPLPAQAAQWGTPTARDWKDGASGLTNVDENGLLGRQVISFQPLVTTDYSLPVRPTPSGEKLPETRRRLNPLFVEWLMGWPEGLSGFDTAETGLSHWLRLSRGELLRLVSPKRPADGQGSLFDG
jgi:DNA (cytosine-5)-methyltransferase 1